MDKLLIYILLLILSVGSVIYLKKFYEKSKSIGIKNAWKNSGSLLFPCVLVIMMALGVVSSLIISLFEEPLPQHVEQFRVSLNEEYNKVVDYEENTLHADKKILYGKYYDLQKKTKNYREMLSNIGRMDRYNNNFEVFVNERTQYYLNEASKISEPKKKIYTCSICGRQTGKHADQMWKGKCYMCFEFSKKKR